MQDLSGLAKNSLATDSMHAGNQVWDRNSMTAPGTDSADAGLGSKPGEGAIQDAPTIQEIGHTRTVLHPEAPPVNSSPFPRTPLGGPREWVKSQNQMVTQGQAPAGGWDDDHKAAVPPEKKYGGSSNG